MSTSILAMQAVPMALIARQLGHSDTRMTERHYAHLAPNYVADTIRASFSTRTCGPCFSAARWPTYLIRLPVSALGSLSAEPFSTPRSLAGNQAKTGHFLKFKTGH
jgi:hypothetical protein